MDGGAYSDGGDGDSGDGSDGGDVVVKHWELILRDW